MIVHGDGLMTSDEVYDAEREGKQYLRRLRHACEEAATAHKAVKIMKDAKMAKARWQWQKQ
jgi:galactokinase